MCVKSLGRRGSARLYFYCRNHMCGCEMYMFNALLTSRRVIGRRQN